MEGAPSSRDGNPEAPPDRPPTHNAAQRGSGASDETRIVTRNSFNNFEIRRLLNIGQTDEVDYRHLYGTVMGNVAEMVQQALNQTQQGDVIQLKLRGDMLRSQAAAVVSVADGGDFSQFQDLLDGAVQSNMEVLTDGSLELVIQVVRNPQGGGKRLLAKTLDCKIVQKKQRFMYIVNNRNNELCFAINLAHLLYPGITDAEAERRGSELQQRAGLTAQTPVCFTDVEKFEELVQRRIVIFYRTDLKRLNTFHTAKQRPGKPLYMFLFENHYYGLKNACAFIGMKYLCSHCYTGYDGLLNHKCEGRCNVCLDAACAATRPA
ncbi:uncharacterized protein LOC121201921 [Betta splendens]|uniref:Uncharacterized protein LOC121201921 n=1 Tax=Betta splendens TaxID=158456 RepID=A0A8M1H8S0_BETSP|nr:uncharacterized protein LOC121201921 [Betta splendens]